MSLIRMSSTFAGVSWVSTSSFSIRSFDRKRRRNASPTPWDSPGVRSQASTLLWRISSRSMRRIPNRLKRERRAFSRVSSSLSTRNASNFRRQFRSSASENISLGPSFAIPGNYTRLGIFCKVAATAPFRSRRNRRNQYHSITAHTRMCGNQRLSSCVRNHRLLNVGTPRNDWEALTGSFPLGSMSWQKLPTHGCSYTSDYTGLFDGGGGGSRTPVRRLFTPGSYVRFRSFASRPRGPRPAGFPSDHPGFDFARPPPGRGIGAIPLRRRPSACTGTRRSDVRG